MFVGYTVKNCSVLFEFKVLEYFIAPSSEVGRSRIAHDPFISKWYDSTGPQGINGIFSSLGNQLLLITSHIYIEMPPSEISTWF